MKLKGWIGENVNVSTLMWFSATVTMISYGIIWPSDPSFSPSSLKNQLCVQWTNRNRKMIGLMSDKLWSACPGFSASILSSLSPLLLLCCLTQLDCKRRLKILLKSAFSHPEPFLYLPASSTAALLLMTQNTDIRLWISGGDVTSSSDTHLVLLLSRQTFI